MPLPGTCVSSRVYRGDLSGPNHNTNIYSVRVMLNRNTYHGHPTSWRWSAAWSCLLALGLNTAAQEGAVDASFQSPAFDAPVPLIAAEAGGNVLCISVTNSSRYSLVRLTSTGSADPGFNPGDGPEVITPPVDVGTTHIPGATNPATINALLPLPNGQCIVGGTFNHFNKVARKLLVRLNQDGSVDPSFNAADGFVGNAVNCIVPGKSGQLYAGGKFSKFGASPRNIGLVRLNEDGSLDSSFVDGTIFFGATVVEASVQPDGKPLIVAAYANGSFQATAQVFRLGANGGLDSTFTQGAGTSAAAVSPLRHGLMADGHVLVTGGAAVYSGVTVNTAMFRLDANGAVENVFPTRSVKMGGPSSGLIGRFLPTPSGAIYFSGAFDHVDGEVRQGLARLNADGTLDPAFAPAVYVSPSPGALALQADGKVLVCAGVIVGTTPKYVVVRLNGSGGTLPERPRLGGFALLGGGTNQFQVAGGPTTMIVQGSSDLASWQNIATNDVTGGVLRFVDTVAGQFAARFYRLLQAP